jgi:polysaccharide export outer membrane protein
MTQRLFSHRRAAWTVVTALVIAGAFAAAAAAQPAADYVIGPPDVLTIQVFDQQDLGGKYTVEADGSFSFPLIGRIKAGGMTLRGFENELKRQLADGYFKNPSVSVSVEQYRSQRVFVMGEVRQPGPVPLTGGMTLIEALARAGSTLPTASGEVSIVRAESRAGLLGPPEGLSGPPPFPGASQAAPDEPLKPDQEGGSEIFRASIRDLESGTLSQNLQLRDGDTIFVPRAESVYVFGHVKNPGAYGVQKNTTVLQALSLAGGLTENAAMNRIQIIRIENGQKRELKVKVTDKVRAEDTIIVPQRYF